MLKSTYIHNVKETFDHNLESQLKLLQNTSEMSCINTLPDKAKFKQMWDTQYT